MGTTTAYVPYDYRRVCDMCGNLFQRSRMHKKDPYVYCDAHAGERTNEELDRANARARPFRILPVPNAKPDDPIAPDTLRVDDSAIVALLDLGLGAGARYVSTVSGSATPLPSAADVIPANAWACRYYYGLITRVYPKGVHDDWTAQALARMRAAADRLLALQSTTGTRATNSYLGGFLASGVTYYYSEDAAIAGLACLYAYRSLGDPKYIWGARNAASFLRNLQAIGKHGVNFTSSDSAGTSRLYTGGITNFVSTTAGFYSDHRFYPSSLLALQFWNELKATDGDQAIGATAAVAGDFTTAPAAQLSDCIADLRAFWSTGVGGVCGLSATTPYEAFNAYPATKANTNGVTGTGAWEYQDGGAATGTLVTSMNFAKALSSLYAYEGLTAQVQAVDDWMQAASSNTAYAATTTAPHIVQHVTTGTYDPARAPAQLLLVRDSTASYAAVNKNGSSLYDWGAFGLMSPLWSARRNLAFKNARYQASLKRRRYSDGLPADWDWMDSGVERGRQGLGYQTGFTETLAHGSGKQA